MNTQFPKPRGYAGTVGPEGGPQLYAIVNPTPHGDVLTLQVVPRDLGPGRTPSIARAYDAVMNGKARPFSTPDVSTSGLAIDLDGVSYVLRLHQGNTWDATPAAAPPTPVDVPAQADPAESVTTSADGAPAGVGEGDDGAVPGGADEATPPNADAEPPVTAAPCPDPVSIGASRVVYGFPTTGKTAWADAAQRADPARAITDTDNLIAALHPRWFKAKLWQTASPEDHAQLDALIGGAARALLDNDPNAIVVTNLWGPRFREALGTVYAPGGKLPLGVYRPDPVDVAAISETRGAGVIPLETASQWLAPETVVAMHASVEQLIELRGTGCYMGDVILLPNGERMVHDE